MKEKIKSSKKVVVFLLVVLTTKFYAQSPTDSLQVLIGDISNSVKHINKVKSEISQFNGVRLIGFCSNHNIFMVYADKSIYANNESFLNAFTANTGLTQVLLKDGVFADIIGFCTFNDNAEYNSIKKELDK